MAGKGIIIMSAKELKRLPVIHNVINKQLTQIDAANILGLSTRQVRRITKKLKQQGDIALIHRSRGRLSNRAISTRLKGKILYLCKSRYKGFNPTLASEKLFEIEKISINHETLRGWFIEAGIDYRKRKARKHRTWRPRKDSFGQMVQLDGSHHDWLEGRGPWCVLMGYIDDATGRIFGHFYGYEGTMPAMDSFKRYIKKYGIPQSIYLDRHSTYKSTQKPTLEDELANQKAQSQFERALNQLGVDIIHANSPQAKGRIERSFKTHQDRLVKELRLKNITSIEDANKLLHAYYIPRHNARFAMSAKTKANLHRPIPKSLNLSRIFSVKNSLALRNDFTIRHNNQFYQVLEPVRTKEVTLEERLDGKFYIYHKERQLEYKPIDKKPERPRQPYRPRKPRYVPPQDHIYRKFKIKNCA
jgi:transposase